MSQDGSDPSPGPIRREGRELDGWAVLAIFRRRLVLIGSITGAAIFVSVVWLLTRPDEYSTSALVQKQEQVSPLIRSADPGRGGGIPSTMESEAELLRSDAILVPVVRDLALNVSVPGRGEQRSRFLAGARLDGDPVPGLYHVEPRGGELALVRNDSDEVLATAGAGDTLAGPGLRLPAAEFAVSDERVPLAVKSVGDAVLGLRRDLQIEPLEATNLIRIRYTARDPELAAAVVNGVAASYQRRATEVVREEAARKRAFLGEQLTKIADSVAALQSDLADFQQQTQVIDPASEGEGLNQSLRQARLEARQLAYEQGVLESLVRTLGAEGSTEGLERIVTLTEDLIPGGEAVYGRLRELEEERRRLTLDRFGFREGSSRVAVIDSLIDDSRQQLLGLVRESSAVTSAALSDARQEVRELESRLGQLPARATQIDRLGQNADAVVQTFSLLSERYYEAQIEEAVASADVAVVDVASPPQAPQRRGRLFPILIATVLGASLACLLAFILEAADRTVRRLGDAEGASGRPVIGTVPTLPVETSSHGRVFDEAEKENEDLDPHRESFRTLATVLRLARGDTCRVYVVTSQGPGEGKSFVAYNLAAAMAQQGARTLLLDCDFYRPALHELHQIERDPGVLNVLSDRLPIERVAKRSTDADFWVAPAGRSDTPAEKLIGSGRLREVIETVRESCDALFLDAPPVLAAAGTLEIAALADFVLVITRVGRTPIAGLREACARLRTSGGSIEGVVLNGVETADGFAGDDGYYYRYHHYGYDKQTKERSPVS